MAASIKYFSKGNRKKIDAKASVLNVCDSPKGGVYESDIIYDFP